MLGFVTGTGKAPLAASLSLSLSLFIRFLFPFFMLRFVRIKFWWLAASLSCSLAVVFQPSASPCVTRRQSTSSLPYFITLSRIQTSPQLLGCFLSFFFINVSRAEPAKKGGGQGVEAVVTSPFISAIGSRQDVTMSWLVSQVSSTKRRRQ